MTEKDFRKRLDKIRAAINIISDEMNMLYVEFSEFEKRATAPNRQSAQCSHVFKQCAAHSVICETCNKVFPLR